MPTSTSLVTGVDFVSLPTKDLAAARDFYEIPKGTVLGVRPEHVRIGTYGVRTRVDLVEVAGSDSYVHLDLGLVARVPAHSRPADGAGVSFDEATGERREWQ